MYLLVASNNQGKIREIKEMLAAAANGSDFCVLSLADAGIAVDVEETGTTFEENARLKANAIREILEARADRSEDGSIANVNANSPDTACVTADPRGAARATPVLADNTIVIADDSGLCVDWLDGAPGVYSARYAGADATDAQRVEKLLNAMREAPPDRRSARFQCVIAMIFPEGRQKTVTGVWEGCIAASPSGQNGFGYDPVFYDPARQCTAAQMPSGEKHAASHRGKAVRLMLGELEDWSMGEQENRGPTSK